VYTLLSSSTFPSTVSPSAYPLHYREALASDSIPSRMACGWHLPKPLEAIGRQLGIKHRMLDVAVPQIMLDGAGVMAIVGELEPAGMA
jgi:hypothetical protein